MSQHTETKINKILQNLPKNAVATTKWLGTFGVTSDLLNRYKQSQWFTEIGHGAVIRTGDQPNWVGAVYALQNQLQIPIHVGGKTAIGYQGFAHYIPLGTERIVLYCPYGTTIPKWFEKFDWKVDIRVVKTSLFPTQCNTAIKTIEVAGFTVQVAALERAMMETLLGIPDKESFDEAKKLMEGLNTLRPDTVQELLEKCDSIKVKRVFLLLAERENHPWFERIKTDTINLGSGNRVLVKNGIFDKKYRVTVPQNWREINEYSNE